MPQPIFTIGHSTRAIDDFVAILKAHGVDYLVDIRTVPRSRTNPQFNRDVLPLSLATEAIQYEHLASLGGLRHARADSPNTGWRNASFRGYADYMSSAEFHGGLERLIEISSQHTPAVMCAEAVPWRCHRSLVADALVVRDLPVEHIMSSTKRQPHTLTPFAHIEGERIIYRVA